MTKSCGTCTMCCKSMGMVTDESSIGSWCPFCAIGKGCTDYDARPQECARFDCVWLKDETLGPEWRPDIAGFVLAAAQDRLIVHLDAARPDDWQRAPYRDGIARMAARGPVVLELRGRFTPLPG